MGEIIDIKIGLPKEPDTPHLTLQTLDNKVHIIPVSVFTDIISGKMKLTDIDDWEMIARTALSIVLAVSTKEAIK
ncbi:MAG: hypothetical protein KKC03_13900 [Bacteroidetes bacterium]|nr:hypothetical protein [Bacteroidota bacterium]